MMIKAIVTAIWTNMFYKNSLNQVVMKCCLNYMYTWFYEYILQKMKIVLANGNLFFIAYSNHKSNTEFLTPYHDRDHVVIDFFCLLLLLLIRIPSDWFNLHKQVIFYNIKTNIMFCFKFVYLSIPPILGGCDMYVVKTLLLKNRASFAEYNCSITHNSFTIWAGELEVLSLWCPSILVRFMCAIFN